MHQLHFAQLIPRRLSAAALKICPRLAVRSRRLFSTSETPKLQYPQIFIRYASQGGTAQLFAQQLHEALEEAVTPEVVTTEGAVPEIILQAWDDVPPDDFFGADPKNRALYLLLTSTAGIGEPPENGKLFYQWLLSQQLFPQPPNTKIPFALFGLGNKLAHPNHFNACAVSVYDKLMSLPNQPFQPVLPLTLGDDSACLDDDFDQWQEQVIEYIVNNNNSNDTAKTAPTTKEQQQEQQEKKDQQPDINIATAAANSALSPANTILCKGSKSSDGRRLASSNPKKYPTLQLDVAGSEVVRADLLDLPNNQHLYDTTAQLLTVNHLQSLNTHDPTASALHELRLQVPTTSTNEQSQPLYEAGDHVKIFPRNAEYLVQAYADVLDVYPHAIVNGPIDKDKQDKYPFPTGITVWETLSHCVDLSAVPSPSFARFLLNSSSIDYKNDIAGPRRTVLDLLLEQKMKHQQESSSSSSLISLEDFLYNMPPMQGRYYSIASSSKVHPDEIYLTFRPLRYVTTRGNRMQGVCTSYMSGLTHNSHVVASIQSNPKFRLPSDTNTPVVLMAGGCGVAPIRAFVEERLFEGPNGGGSMYLFLGFRNPDDEVYQDMIDEVVQTLGAKAYVTYTTGCHNASCGLVTDAIRKHAQEVYELIYEQNANVYLCGGARTFGVAVEHELHHLMKQYGSMTDEQATDYLRDMAAAGRLHEDLAD